MSPEYDKKWWNEAILEQAQALSKAYDTLSIRDGEFTITMYAELMGISYDRAKRIIGKGVENGEVERRYVGNRAIHSFISLNIKS